MMFWLCFINKPAGFKYLHGLTFFIQPSDHTWKDSISLNLISSKNISAGFTKTLTNTIVSHKMKFKSQFPNFLNKKKKIFLTFNFHGGKKIFKAKTRTLSPLKRYIFRINVCLFKGFYKRRSNSGFSSSKN